MRRIGLGLAIAAVVAAAAIPLVGAEAHRAPAQASDKVLLFAADGMRQDAVERYAGQGRMPAMRELLRRGAKASGNGLLTQAPPNTGAGWYTLATGAWPGVSGALNNTFHINGQPFGNRAGGLDPGILQAETIAQSAERGGKKVAQIEWAGGRSGRHRRPHGRLPQFPLRPRRGDELHRAGRLGRLHPVVRAPVRPSRRVRGPGGVPRRRADRRHGLDQRPRVVQPREGDAPARDRRRRPTSTASTPTSTTAATTGGRATTASCSRPPRTATTPSATCARASGPTSR